MYIICIEYNRKNIRFNIFHPKTSSVQSNFLSVIFYVSTKSSLIQTVSCRLQTQVIAFKVEQRNYITISVSKVTKF